MKGWRTISLNIAIAIFGILEATDWTTLLGSDKAAWVLAAVAAINMVLRVVTDTAVGRTT